ncbi:MAG: hypothetical protein AAGA48_22740 [Myxococcota bacterium]
MWWMLVACGSGPAGDAVPEGAAELAEVTPDAAKFLDGCWRTEEGESPSECWTSRDKYYNGSFNDAREGAQPKLLLMRLATMPDKGLALGVQLAGNKAERSSSILELVAAGDNTLHFRRDGTGYPTEVLYALKGDELTVTHRGNLDEEAVERRYVMTRKPAP